MMAKCCVDGDFSLYDFENLKQPKMDNLIEFIPFGFKLNFSNKVNKVGYKWSPPSLGFFKINIDCSSHGNQGVAMMGGHGWANISLVELVFLFCYVDWHQ